MQFMWLIFAHFIGDWALQSDWIAKNKEQYWYVMLAHCMIWTCCICIALQFIGTPIVIWTILFLVVGHGVCDTIKARANPEGNWWLIYPDQTWHIIQCLIVFFL